MPWIIAGVAVAGGAGYYFTRESPDDVKAKANQLQHAAKLRSQEAVDEGKAKYGELKVRFYIMVYFESDVNSQMLLLLSVIRTGDSGKCTTACQTDVQRCCVAHILGRA